MKMSFACEAAHEREHPMVGHTVRVELDRGVCPICPDHELKGTVYGGLDWAECTCCGSSWRLEEDGFALRPGRILEEWS